MALFGKHKDQPTKAPAMAAPTTVGQSSPGSDLGMQSGKISLQKGQRVSMVKTSVIKATCSWSSETDYDVYAIAGLRNGSIVTAAQFGTNKHPKFEAVVANGAIKHMGDVGRGTGGKAQEIIEIRLTDEVKFVVIVAYSAQSNGSGSFRRYQVSTTIDNGQGTIVGIDAKNASDNDGIYTVVAGIIWNSPDGVVIEAREQYSHGGENRPLVHPDGRIEMDKGEKNVYK